MKYIALLFLIGLFAGCSSQHHDPTPVKTSNTFRLYMPSLYNTSLTDDGVIFHDKNGKSLGWKSFESGDSVKMTFDRASVGDTIMVTIYSVSTDFKKEWTLQTFTNVPANDSWQVNYPSGNSSSILGKFNVTLTGQIFPGDVWLTDNHGATALAQQINNTKDRLSITITNNTNLLFLYVNGVDGPKYKSWNNPQINTTDSVDYSQLSTYDKVVPLTLPVAVIDPYIDVLAYNQDTSPDGYGSLQYCSLFSPLVTTNAINVYYVNGYDQYSTALTFNFDDYRFQYMKRGNLVTQPYIPGAADYKITDKGFSSFAFTSKRSFVRRHTQFTFSNAQMNVNWIVNARAGAAPILDLPSDFSAANPMIKLSDLNAVNSDFYIYSTKSFSDLIAEKYKGKPIFIYEEANEEVF